MSRTRLAAAVLIALAPMGALATDGYFSHGYGMKSKGMAGASTTYTNDTFGGANNPAAMVWVGNRFDVGLDYFSPDRDAERSGSGAGLNGSATSGSKSFWVPEGGYNRMLNPTMSLGVTVYGNGGMNTNYPSGQISGSGAGVCQFFRQGTRFATAGTNFNLLCGDGNLGVDLSQLVVAPTFSWKATPEHSFGVSPLLGYQRFRAEGLQGFAAFSTDSASMTNNGYDSAYGWGMRVGWLGKVSDSVTLGAAYSTKIGMSNFDRYKGLFAEQGGFDMPSNYSVGASFKVSPKATVAVDYKRINYADVKSVSNPSAYSIPGPFGIPNSLGGSDGRGFGWQSVNVYKIGFEYQWNNDLTLRAGYGHTDNPIKSADVTFNILAPAVVTDHYTAGFTYALGGDMEITTALMVAPRKSVTGASLYDQFMGPGAGGTEKISMREYSLGVAFEKRF